MSPHSNPLIFQDAGLRRQAMQQDLASAREQQLDAKEQRLAELAREERRIFERIISVQRMLSCVIVGTCKSFSGT